MTPKRLLIKEEFVKLTGQISHALILDLLIDLSLNQQSEWVCISLREIDEQLFIGSLQSVRRYILDLMAAALIDRREVKRNNRNSRMNYRINFPVIRDQLAHLGYCL